MPEPTLIEHDSIKDMTPIERSQAQMRVAMKDLDHMIKWAVESGREWLVFNTRELLRAFPKDPEAQQACFEYLTQLVALYRDHRSVTPSTDGGVVEQKDPATGKIIETPKTKPETLELAEWDRLIRWAIGQATTIDPDWSLERSPM